ncbi:MAG: efflux transporter periplasmic adaptor subunit, partial [Chloroflexi bacterium]|nr:efflux transporter periplasmic adaptor subunit [Chloroflexota bacterium]
FVRVALVHETRDNAVLVPEQAIVPIGGRKFVYRLIDGRVVQTEVAIGERIGTRVEIRAGVAAGELVVTAGQLRIGDGEAVRIRAPADDG